MTKGTRVLLGGLATLVLASTALLFLGRPRVPFTETLKALKGYKAESTEVYWSEQQNLATGTRYANVTRLDTYRLKESFDTIFAKLQSELRVPTYHSEGIAIFPKTGMKWVRLYRKDNDLADVIVVERYEQSVLENAFRWFKRSTGMDGPPKNHHVTKVPGPKGGSLVESYQLN